MGTDVLVESRLEDGTRLIRELIRDGFEVAVAFWVRISEHSLWYLYIASSGVNEEKPNDAYRIVYAALSRIPDCSVSPSEIKLLSKTNPIARDAIALRDRYSSREPVHYHGRRLANLPAEELCIYPRRFPLVVRPLPDGSWQVLISEIDDVWLDCDSEDDARAIAAAPVLEDEALGQLRFGDQFARELERTADAMEKYRMSFGSRFMRRRAQEARE